jgi:hypothetical protein
MAKSIERRIEQLEKQLCIDEQDFVFEENGVERKIEMSLTDLDKLMQEIRAESKGIPVKYFNGLPVKEGVSL